MKNKINSKNTTIETDKMPENNSVKHRINLGSILNFIAKSILILIGLMILKTMDFSWIKGEVTGYSKSCSEWNNKDDCILYVASRKYTFKINETNQTVFELGEYGTDRYTKCTIADKNNWECKYDDESGIVGFVKGKYFTQGLDFDKYTINRLSQEDVGLSRFEWLIQKNIDSGCDRLNPICYLLN